VGEYLHSKQVLEFKPHYYCQKKKRKREKKGESKPLAQAAKWGS
jgi:hypothetical protein